LAENFLEPAIMETEVKKARLIAAGPLPFWESFGTAAALEAQLSPVFSDLYE
jgi:hypothetical protein